LHNESIQAPPHLILRTRGIGNLVFFGITTGGIVLSTLRRAFDLDYRCRAQGRVFRPR
jgi:nicotinamidase-related amidase